jgi:hypothetical protein
MKGLQTLKEYGLFQNHEKPPMHFNYLAQVHCPLANWISCWSPFLTYSFDSKKCLFPWSSHVCFYPHETDHMGSLRKDEVMLFWFAKSNIKLIWDQCQSGMNGQKLFPRAPSVPSELWTTSWGPALGDWKGKWTSIYESGCRCAISRSKLGMQWDKYNT